MRPPIVDHVPGWSTWIKACAQRVADIRVIVRCRGSAQPGRLLEDDKDRPARAA
jgi:hypothetical protein